MIQNSISICRIHKIPAIKQSIDLNDLSIFRKAIPNTPTVKYKYQHY